MIAEIQIPDCEDIEWQQKMLGELAKQLEKLEMEIPEDDGQEMLAGAQKIVEALQIYSGFSDGF